MGTISRICALAVPLLLAGCHCGMHWLSEPVRSQSVKAESGERFYFDLPEGGSDRLRWSAKSDDDDVTVMLDHKDDHAAVEIRVHRGFDGPSQVTFTASQRKGTPPGPITLTLFKRVGDHGFWL